MLGKQLLRSLQIVKEKMTISPILRGPNWALLFHINIDASHKVVGAVLGQVEENFPYAIYFISKNLSKAELNYTVIEKELLVVVHYLNKFRNYITGDQTLVHTDNVTIKYLMNELDVNARIIRWLSLLEQFDLTIVDKAWKENVVENFLLQLTPPIGKEKMIDY